jgi:hypothetical protein
MSSIFMIRGATPQKAGHGGQYIKKYKGCQCALIPAGKEWSIILILEFF